MSATVKLVSKASTVAAIKTAAEMLKKTVRESGSNVIVNLGSSYGEVTFKKNAGSNVFEVAYDNMRDREVKQFMQAVNLAEVKMAAESIGFRLLKVSSDPAQAISANKDVALTFSM